MLKTTLLLQMLTTNKVFVARMLAADDISSIEDSDGLIKKFGKLSKTGKLSKSGNLKGKKLSKSENSPNFSAKKAGPSFLTPKTRAVFNYLWLFFTKVPILWHFDPEYHIRIKTDISGYAIGDLLS